jgi:hypothetical protein
MGTIKADESYLDDFIPDPEGTPPPVRRPRVRTSFVPDDRFTRDEINAVLAYEASGDLLACLRRSDPTYRTLMHSAIAKGYDLARGHRGTLCVDDDLP